MSRRTAVDFRGVRVSKHTRNMVLWAEKRAGFRFHIAQGSWSGAAASAGTHTGPGAIDIGAAGLSKAQRVAAVHALKNAGFAAWYRRSVPGLWGPHIHCVAFGEKCAPGAQAQKGSYDRHRDGLAGDGYDKTYRPNPKVKWGYLRKRPVRRK
jgi:hypothetical protein